MKVYLAGAITGVKLIDAVGWRIQAMVEFEKAGIKYYNPVGQDVFKVCSTIMDVVSEEGHDLTTIWERNFREITQSDFMLVYLSGEVSQGTLLEIGYALAKCIPIIAVVKNNCYRKWVPELFCSKTFEGIVDAALYLVSYQKSSGI